MLMLHIFVSFQPSTFSLRFWKKLRKLHQFGNLLKPLLFLHIFHTNKNWSRLTFIATIKQLIVQIMFFLGSFHHHSGVIIQKSLITYVILIHLKMYTLKHWFIECHFFFCDWMRKRGLFHFVSFFFYGTKSKISIVFPGKLLKHLQFQFFCFFSHLPFAFHPIWYSWISVKFVYFHS